MLRWYSSSHHHQSPLPPGHPPGHPPDHPPSSLTPYPPHYSPNPTTPNPIPHPTLHSHAPLFLKGPNQSKKFVKSAFLMSLNLFRTLLSLKTSFLIIFMKNNFWDKIDQKLEYDGGGVHVQKYARAMSLIHFSTCKILPLKKTLISHFQVISL